MKTIFFPILFLSLLLYSCITTQKVPSGDAKKHTGLLSSKLIAASKKGDLNEVRILISKGADINAVNNWNATSLYSAVYNGHNEIALFLIGKGADVNIKQKEGFTPLIFASGKGHLETVKALLGNGADINAANNWNVTPLYSAVYNGHNEVALYLIGKGADVNIKHIEGFTSLMIASQKGYLEIVKALLEKGAFVNAENIDGNTALILASSPLVIKILLAGGADPEIKNQKGETTLSLAAKQGKAKKLEFLLAGMKKRDKSVDDVMLMYTKPIMQIDTGGHKSLIRDMFFTNNGNHLISVSEDKTCRIWDVRSGRGIRVLRGQIGGGFEGRIQAAALSPNDQLLALGVKSGSITKIRLIDLQTGKIRQMKQFSEQSIADLAFSSDGNQLLSGHTSKIAYIWDVASGKIIHKLKGHHDVIYAVVFSPDKKKVVTGSDDKTLKLWDSSSGKLLADMKGHENEVISVAYTPDGKYILSGGEDKTIRLWEGQSGKFIKILATQTSAIPSLCISPDGTKVVTGSAGSIQKFDNVLFCTSGNNVFSIPSGKLLTTFRKHDNIVLATAISPDGTIVATAGGQSNEIYLWDIKSGKVKHRLVGTGGIVWSVGFSKDGKSIGWGKTSNAVDRHHLGPLEQSLNLRESVSRFNVKLGKKIGTKTQVDTNLSPSHFLRSIDSVDNFSITTPNKLYHPTLLIKKNGKIIHEITRDNVNGADHRGITITPDGKTVISGGSFGILTSYNSETGEKNHDFVGHQGDVFSVAVSPDSRYLISGSADQTVKLWAIASGKLLLTIFHSSDGEWVAWIPEGYYVASPKGDKYVGWHVNKGMDQPADYYSAKQFRRYLYRPDVVNDTLELGSSQKALKKAGLEKITISELIQRAPVDVQITNIHPIGSDEVEVNIELSKNKITTPERMTIYINGAQMLTEERRQLAGVKPGDKLSCKLTLPDRDNHIRVVMENKWAETDDVLHYSNPKWKKRNKPSGTLFVTVVGISNYPNLSKEQQLISPGRDAEAIANRFLKLNGRLYEKVIINKLIDTDGLHITSSKVEDLLNEQTQKAGPQDTSIVFLAGHGINDSTGNYHFITADSQIKARPDKGIILKNGTSFDWVRLHAILDKTMGRRIVIVDTCQAGSIFSATKNDVSKLVKDIHDINALVYSGTSRQQYGLETEKGGVFTNSILMGIDGSAKYENSLLPFNNLRKYVDKQVPMLNKAIMLSQFQRAVIKKTNKARTIDEVDFDSIQNPVAVIPDGMEAFAIYKK